MTTEQTDNIDNEPSPYMSFHRSTLYRDIEHRQTGDKINKAAFFWKSTPTQRMKLIYGSHPEYVLTSKK